MPTQNDSPGAREPASLTQQSFPSAGPSNLSHTAEHAGTHDTFTFISNEYPLKEHSVELSPQPQNRIPSIIPPSPSASDVIRYLDGLPITEGSKMTHALVGATFVQPAIVEYQGKKAIMFVFAVSFESVISPQVRLTLLYTGPRSESRG